MFMAKDDTLISHTSWYCTCNVMITGFCLECSCWLALYYVFLLICVFVHALVTFHVGSLPDLIVKVTVTYYVYNFNHTTQKLDQRK